MSACFCFTSYRSKRYVLAFHLLVPMSCSHVHREWNCHFLLRSRAAIMLFHALASASVLVIVALTYIINQLFSCRARKIVRCAKRDNCNSSHVRPSLEVCHSAKTRERQKEKKKAGPVTYLSHDPPAAVWENAGKEFRLRRLEGKWRECHVGSSTCLLKSWIWDTWNISISAIN